MTFIWKWCSAHEYTRGCKQCCKLQASLLLMNSLNKTDTSIFLIRSGFFVSKGNQFDAYITLLGVGSLYANQFLFSVLRVTSGPRVKFTKGKSALTPPPTPPPPPGGLFYWPFWGGCPGVSLTLCCIVVYSARWFVLCLTLCYFVLVFFSPFSIAITLLGEKRVSLKAFRTFVRFALV